MTNKTSNPFILVTGATGYVGSRLASALAQRGNRVRCMARRMEFVDPTMISNVEWVEADALKPETLDSALKEVRVVYYLIHSMGANKEFAELDRQAAKNFADAARRLGVERIIFLGGLGDGTEELSPHLKSRQEIGKILCESGLQIIELRASIIIGPGSISFELIRHLVERLPVMITPKWVSIKTQPIFIDDVVEYLLKSKDLRITESSIFEIGGPEVLSYGDLMKSYAKMRKLRRFMIPVPFVTPRLSSLWLQLVTPVYARVGRKLIDSLVNQTIVTNRNAKQYFDASPTTSTMRALELADENERIAYNDVRWANVDSYVSRSKLYPNITTYGRRLYHIEKINSSASDMQIYHELSKLGSEHGWYYANWLWKIRGAIDILVGGVGLRSTRNRKHPQDLKAGDIVGFWRVEKAVPGELLLLFAEMRLPGRAWLQFEIQPTTNGCKVYQTAIFDPKGLLGLAYWYSLIPIHYFIFSGMLKAIIHQAEKCTIYKNHV